jgi:signal transduction histidine kinase
MFENKKEIILLIVLGTSILIFLLSVVVITIARYKIRQQSFLKEKIDLETQFSQTLLQSQLEIQEQTLQQISRELHDNLGQVASLIKINLNTLQLNDRDKAVEKIESTKDLTRQLIGDIKSLSVNLNGNRIAETGLIKALQNEVDQLNRTGIFSAKFIQTGPFPEIKNDTVIILYRMAQEILNNMIKHSNAQQIIINLSVTKNLFILAFSDDGNGFDIEKQMKSGGSGLNNLHIRANLINAKLSMQSDFSKGTNTSIELAI